MLRFEQRDGLRAITAGGFAGDTHAAAADGILHAANDQLQPRLFRALIAESDHFRKIVARVDVQQRERRLRRRERLHRQMQQHGAILAAGEHQSRAPVEGQLAQNVHRLGFETIEPRGSSQRRRRLKSFAAHQRVTF